MRIQDRKFLAGAGALALGLAAFVSPWASGSPDGLERVAEDKGFLHLAEAPPVWRASPMADYGIGFLGEGAVSTGAAGALGVLAAWGLSVLAARLTRIRFRRPARGQPEAAGE